MRNEELAVKAALVVLNYPKGSYLYGDDYLQATFVGFLAVEDENKAIEYIESNYQRVEPIVFEKMLEVVMYLDDEKTKDLMVLLKRYSDDKKDDKQFWEEIRSRTPYDEQDIVKNFLESMKSDGNSPTA